ncbi:unnamed protein product, partial [Amoebophrya sp. A120]|eukprot:GSA120T00013800001.1
MTSIMGLEKLAEFYQTKDPIPLTVNPGGQNPKMTKSTTGCCGLSPNMVAFLSSPACSGCIATALRNRAKTDHRIHHYLPYMLAVIPHFESHRAVMKCVASAICMAFLAGSSYVPASRAKTDKTTADTTENNNNGVPLDELFIELEQKGTWSALYVLGALPYEVSVWTRSAVNKAAMLKRLRNDQNNASNNNNNIPYAVRMLNVLEKITVGRIFEPANSGQMLTKEQ